MGSIEQAYKRLDHVIASLQLTRADHDTLHNDLSVLYMKAKSAEEQEDDGRTNQ